MEAFFGGCFLLLFPERPGLCGLLMRRLRGRANAAGRCLNQLDKLPALGRQPLFAAAYMPETIAGLLLL